MDLMTEGQWKRWDVVSRLRAGKLTVAQAALVLPLSVRQVRRLRDRVATEGRRALRHRNTGRVPIHWGSIAALNWSKLAGARPRPATQWPPPPPSSPPPWGRPTTTCG